MTMWISVLALLGFGINFIVAKTLQIDLSWRHIRKEDFFLKLQPQINLPEVTHLILRGNEFDNFLDCATHLDNLVSLDLSQNHLQRFFILCKEEYNLQVLNVSHNRLEYIGDDALNGRISKLTILDLSNNKLTSVNETMLRHMKVLEFVSLAHNPIGDGLSENAFFNLKSLRHLDLSNISARHFPVVLFEPLTNLTNLSLSSNPIETIPTLPTGLEHLDISRTNIVRPTNLILPQLRELIMNDMNNFTLILLNDFENLTKLNTLSMANSPRLTRLDVLSYNESLLRELQHLSVQNCTLKTLNVYLQPIMQRLVSLNLKNNPWYCDCRLQWINASNITREINREMRCSSPEVHRNKLLSDIPTSELECEGFSSNLHLILWISSLILILGAILANVFFTIRGPLGHWTIRKRRQDTVAYKNVVESSNDLVRILTVSDNNEHPDNMEE